MSLPFDYAQDMPFDYAQDMPFDYAEDMPFGRSVLSFSKTVDLIL